MGKERRVHVRRRSFARVLIEIEGRLGYVADMGPSGFRGLFLDGSTLLPGSRLRIMMAFDELGIAPFELEVLVRWSAYDVGAVEAGFELPFDLSAGARKGFDIIGRYYAEEPLAVAT